jgi:hypothetical protein
MINNLDMSTVREQYDLRYSYHKRLVALFQSKRIDEYNAVALGIKDNSGNYSASEHNLGPVILDNNKASSVFRLAEELNAQTDPKNIVKTIYEKNLKYLKISVGSEMAMMLNPERFWVANVRTVWTHLLIKHKFNLGKANEELKLYRSQELTSEMEYRVWRDIYLLMTPSIKSTCEIGNKVAIEQEINPGNIENLWFDAIANALYENFATN